MTAEPERWQLEGASPELYERYLVPAVTRPWAVDLVGRVGVGSGDHVLDVACGTGVVARVAAEHVGDFGRVAALSQLGLQFFPDPRAALREMRRVLVAGGRLGVSVLAAIERNPATHALSDALDRHLGAGASRAKRSEHSLADVADLRGLFAAAGIAGVRVETVTRTVNFASAAEYVRIQFAATPLAGSLEQLEPHARQRVLELVSADVDARLAPFSRGGRLTFPQVVHVGLARG